MVAKAELAFPREILAVAVFPFSAEVEVLLAPFGGVLECPEEFWQTVAGFPFFGGVVVVLGLFFVVECSSSLPPSSAMVVVWELEEDSSRFSFEQSFPPSLSWNLFVDND